MALALCILFVVFTGCTVTTYGPTYNYDSPHLYRNMQRTMETGTEQPRNHYRPWY